MVRDQLDLLGERLRRNDTACEEIAELALSAGVRLDVVSRQLGHASIGTTANIYTHDSDPAATDAADRLGKTLG